MAETLPPADDQPPSSGNLGPVLSVLLGAVYSQLLLGLRVHLRIQTSIYQKPTGAAASRSCSTLTVSTWAVVATY